MNRNQKILLGLLVLLAIALAYRLANPFRQETVDRLTYAPARTVAIENSQAASPPALVRVDLLQSPPPGGIEVTRDLFQPPAAAKAPAMPDAPQAPPEPEPLGPAEKVQEHFERFKTFGSVSVDNNTYLFLEREKQVLVVTQGDRIDGKYEIIEVGDKSITVSAPELEAPLKIDFEEI